MEKALPGTLDRNTLKQLSAEQLVDIIIEQAIASQCAERNRYRKTKPENFRIRTTSRKTKA